MSKRKAYRPEEGATMVEFALVALLFFFIILTFIDFSRFFATKALLVHGAQRGLDAAQKIQGIEVDTTLITNPADPQLAQFRAARDQVIDIATGVLLNTLGYDDQANPTAPIRVRYHTPIDFVGGNPPDEQPQIMGTLLRPGDSSKLYDDSLFHHVSRCNGYYASCTNPRQSTETMEFLLKEFPLVVQLEAIVETYSPWIDDLVARETAMGWREQRVNIGFQPTNLGPAVPVPPPPGGGGGGGACPPNIPFENGCCGCGGGT